MILEEINGLHGWVLLVATGFVELKNGGLFAVCVPGVSGSFSPAIKARLVLPVIILPSHDKG